MKLLFKIKHTEKLSCIQDLGFHAQDQDHCQDLEVKLCICDLFSLKTAEANSI